MEYELFDYQKDAVKELIQASKDLISNTELKEGKYILLESITGSGKTVISMDYMDKMLNEFQDICFIWITIGTGQLDKQSYNKFKINFGNDINIIDSDTILSKDSLEHKDILVLSWDKINDKDKDGNFTNILMRENEKRNLIQILENTRDNRVKIILLIDESHYVASSETSQEIINIIKPEFSLEITSTPSNDRIPNQIDSKKNKAKHVQVESEEVIKAGAIKKEICINNDMCTSGELSDIETILENALIKYSTLCSKLNQKINPLILIQIPDKDDGKEYRETIEGYLETKEINYDNEKLAIWLSDESDKRNLDNITALNDSVMCLIFKQSIAIGWDCPRAYILIKFREIKSNTFNLQVIGRVLRMPECKHYDDEELNKAYIYTNIKECKIEAGKYSDKVLPNRVTVRDEFKHDKFDLKSEILQKKYKSLDVDKFEREFKRKVEDNFKSIKNLYNISDLKQTYSTGDIKTKNIITEGENIENANMIDRKFTDKDIGIEYDRFIKDISSNHFYVIKNTIKSLFNECIDLVKDDTERINIIDIQKSVLNNKEHFNAIVKNSIDECKGVLEENIKYKEYKPQDELYYNENVLLTDEYEKSFYNKIALGSKSKPKSAPEIIFEKYIDNHEKVLYWIKNNDLGHNYFSILYTYEGKRHEFYPDYIVRFKDSDKVGIYEVKSNKDKEKTTKTSQKKLSLYEYQKRNKDVVEDVSIVEVSNQCIDIDTLGILKDI